MANTHNEVICREIKAAFESEVRRKIGPSQLTDNDFIDFFMNSKREALQEVHSKSLSSYLVFITVFIPLSLFSLPSEKWALNTFPIVFVRDSNEKWTV